jgi:hypothetical protein
MAGSRYTIFDATSIRALMANGLEKNVGLIKKNPHNPANFAV